MLSVPDQRTPCFLGEEVPHGIMGVTQVLGPWGPLCCQERLLWRRTETAERVTLPRLQMPRSLGLDTSFHCGAVFAQNSNEFFFIV